MSNANNNELSVEDRLAKLELELEDSKEDRKLIKDLLRDWIKSRRAAMGQERSMLDGLDKRMRDDEEKHRGDDSV